jgi:hypothetical protein
LRENGIVVISDEEFGGSQIGDGSFWLII